MCKVPALILTNHCYLCNHKLQVLDIEQLLDKYHR